ncbi:hypothetical protein [Salininema proteolyticum]|uniref:Uncharacterized protein n=1 Tax=Salininema proteolyticum TaxID=1607685 RepID=A0ABV8U3H8_9ACTN
MSIARADLPAEFPDARVLGRFGDDTRPMVATCPSDGPGSVFVYTEFPGRRPRLVCVLSGLGTEEPSSTWWPCQELTGMAIRQWVEYEAYRLFVRTLGA